MKMLVARIRSILVPVRGVWSDRPSLDWLIVFVLVGGQAFAVWRGWLAFTVVDLAKDDRMRFYTTLASVSAILFGFATASIGFFYGTAAKGDRIDVMKKVMGERLIVSWKASLTGPLLAVGVALACILGDTGKTGNDWAGWAAECAMVLLAARSVRLRWLFVSTLTLVTLDSKNPSVTVGTEPPRVAKRPQRHP